MYVTLNDILLKKTKVFAENHSVKFRALAAAIKMV